MEDMLTIGAFARACRLSPKALRLYDELDLLRPARVDPETGYRYYALAQLERARLVAWLRRLGMPLARIREVCALAPETAAGEVRAYWAGVEAETAVRRDLAEFLIDQLMTTSRRDTTMLELRHSAHSDRGRVRPANQDTAYAGTRLLAVADGYGPDGGPASSAAVAALRRLETTDLPGGNVLNLLEEALQEAAHGMREDAGTTLTALLWTGSGLALVNLLEEALQEAAHGMREDAGTTLTALLWTGSGLVLVHIGDSRAYLLRHGGLFRITHDHTVVQSLIDEGRLTPEEAVTHPQRALLLKSLSPAAERPDLRLQDAAPGDRLPALLRRPLHGGPRRPYPRHPHHGPRPGHRGPVPDRRGERGGRPGQRQLCGGGCGGDGGLTLTSPPPPPRPAPSAAPPPHRAAAGPAPAVPRSGR